MVTVSEAKKLILENCVTSKIELMKLKEAAGYVLAESVKSLSDSPPFDQSAMDGYAFAFESVRDQKTLNVKGEIQAGSFSTDILKTGGAVRIFTGAPLPPGADTVVMQEKILSANNSITINDEQLIKGRNVRKKGSQTKKGETVVEKGQLLTPAGISFLAGLGISEVKVFSNPSISIIVTGKELTVPGNELSGGKIFESNSYGLVAGINQIGISNVSMETVDDNEAEIINSVTGKLQSDIIILTGGVSVGDYDLVPFALEKCGVKKIFHKVRQKPGKPFYFGKLNETLVFALPGNPAAVMSCFYEFIVPAVSKYTLKNYFRKLTLPLAEDYHKKSGLTFFLKGKTEDQSVAILKNQESYMMNSFAVADCLVEIEEEIEFIKKGDPVNVSMII